MTTVIAVCLLILVGYECEDQPAPTPAVAPAQGGLSEEGKAAVRQFWIHYRRATDLRIVVQTAQSLAEYERALEFDPDHEDALYYRGNVALERGQFEKAQQSWRHLLNVNPHSARAHGQLGALYASGLPGAPSISPQPKRRICERTR